MKYPAFHLPTIRALVLAALLGPATWQATLHAQTVYVWDGAGPNGNLGTASNWQGNAALPSNGNATVEFTDQGLANNPTALNPNLDANYFLGTLDFQGASFFTIGSAKGYGLDLSSGLIQSSTAAQTIAVPTFLLADQTWSFDSGAGALNFTSTSASGQIINLGHTLTLAPQGNNTLNGNISGTGAVTVNSAGVMILTGNNTYTGGTNFAAGAINVGSAGALGSTGTLSFTGGTLQYSAANINDYSARFSTAANQAYSVDTNGQNVTFATPLNGSSASLTKLGAGTLTLTTANSYSGGTYIGGGTLSVGTGGSLNGTGAFTVAAGGTFALSGTGSASLGTLLVQGTYVGQGTSAVTTANVSVSGPAGTSTSSLSVNSLKLNSATFSQTGGNVTTTYFSVGADAGYGQSNYTLEGTGALSVGSTAVVGGSGFGSMTQNGGTFTTNGSPLVVGSDSVGTYTLNGGKLSVGNTTLGRTQPGAMTQNGGTFNAAQMMLGITKISGNSSGISGSLQPSAVTQPDATPTNGNGMFTLHGGSVSAAAVTVGVSGSGRISQDGGTFSTNGASLTLASQTGSFGEYDLSGGTLTVGSVAVGSGKAFFGFGNGVLQAAADSTAFISGLSINYGTMNIDSNGFSIATSNVVGGSTSLVKLGAGTLTLTGTNTYTGGTTVSAGRLVEPNNGNALSTGAVNVASGATVELSNTTGNLVAQAANTFTGAGTVQKTGTGTLSLGGNGGTVTVALAAGGLIDVQAGTLNGSSSYQADYTNNQGGLNIAAGATFNGVEGTIRVGQLTGAGTLSGGYNYGTTGSTTVGVNNASGTFSGVIQDSGILGGTLKLTKAGTGTQTLTGASTYTGGTTINAGTLLAANASGSATGTGAVQVNNTGTLAGNGTVAGAVTVASGGTLLPGSSLAPARLTLGSNLTLNTGSTLAINLGGTAVGSYGQIQFSGTLTLGGNLSVATLNGFTLAVGQTFVILDNTSNAALVSGTFANAPAGLYTDAAGDTFLVNYAANADGGLVPNDVTLTVVPEPSAWTAVVIGMGLLGLGIHRRASHGT